MSIAVILLIFLICLKIRFCRPSEFFVEYMSIDNTNTIKGIFVLLVFISHFSGYIQISDPLYDVLQQKSGQLIVTCFLFYSGFGIHESLVRKGSKYVLSMPKKRMLRVMLQFSMAVLIFFVVRVFQGNPPPWKQLLFSLIGLDAIGNSNWYIPVVVMLYGISFVIFRVYGGGNKVGVKQLILVTICSIMLIKVLQFYRSSYWYNTILCFPAGMWFSYLRTYYENKLCATSGQWIVQVLVWSGCFILFWNSRSLLICYELGAISFSFIVILLTMKVQINNSFLRYCVIFSLFIFSNEYQC